MGRYEKPAILGTYSVDELVEEAASCDQYKPTQSDRVLKDEIEGIEGALERIKSIRT
jgi:hypothetical protein